MGHLLCADFGITPTKSTVSSQCPHSVLSVLIAYFSDLAAAAALSVATRPLGKHHTGAARSRHGRLAKPGQNGGIPPPQAYGPRE